MSIVVTKYCHINNDQIRVNGETVFGDPAINEFSEFIRAAYKFAGMAYPKFYKMDDLCKLALVSTEILLKDTGTVEKYGRENVGVIFQNASSTIDTDLQYQSTIDDRGNYFPSPAVFVYTLPNIMIGEICIRHKIFGENALFIEKEFKPAALVRHIEVLMEQNRMKAAIAGWVEQDRESYDIFVFLAAKHDRDLADGYHKLDPQFLNSIYQPNTLK